MTRTSRTSGVLLVLALLAGCAAGPPPPRANSAPVIVPGRPGETARTIPPGQATPVEQEAPNGADLAFVRDMIVHHGQAVELAELAPDRARRTDVKGLADRIADTQRPEIDMLNRWLALYDLPKVDPAGHGASHAGMPGMATPERVDELRRARGADFDRLFLTLMVAHHEGALTMVETVRKAGASVRVQEIADDVAVTQADEIHRMRGMLGG